MRYIYTVATVFALLCAQTVFSQVNYTANDINPPYAGEFRPGVNLGYLPPWNTFQLGDLAAGNPALGIPGVGAKSTRPGLFDKVLDVYGYGLNVAAYDYYRDLGMEELTAIVGFPSDRHRDWENKYCPDHWNELFKGIYEPIWDDGSDGTPYNEDNAYAAYLYEIVSLYTEQVRFWEIWNEPGLYKGNDSEVFWGEPDYPGSWWVNDPDPCDYSLRAPIEHFVRTLRISYEIIKTISPDDYVAIAGVGSQSFLDAILRNTDNPVDGSITSDYPNLGGAYIDVLGFHTYPHLDGSTSFGPDNYYERHSDGAADGLINRRLGGYQQVLYNYGYDGITYPKKQHICTEINVPRQVFSGDYFGGPDEQVNFIGKALIGLKVNGVHQMHVYSISDKVDEWDAGFEFDLMGLYKKLEGVQPYNQQLNEEGIAYKTAADLIYPTSYDEAHTASLNAQPGTRAYAFAKPDGGYIYALWAETQVDLSESASANFSFPTSLNISNLTRYEWDWSNTGDSETINASNIQLDARPIYLESAGTQQNVAPSPTLSTASSTVNGSFDVDVTWTEDISGFSASDFIVTNGSVASLTGSTTSYTARVEATNAGDVTLRLPAAAAQDLEGLNSLASNTLMVTSSIGGGGSTGSTDADLELELTASSATVEANESITFLLTARNTGRRDASNVIIEFPVPEYFAYTSDIPSQGDYSSWLANWDVGNIDAGESATLEVVLYSLSDETRTAFAQVINLTEFDADSEPGNGACCVAQEDDEAAFTVNGNAPPTQYSDLALTMTSPATAVATDGTFEVTLVIRNDGPDPTTGVRTRISLPNNVTTIGSSIPNGTQLNGAVWSSNRLNNGEIRTLVLQLQTSDPAIGAVVSAEIIASSQLDPDSTPDNGAPGEDDRGILILDGIAPPLSADLALVLSSDQTTYKRSDQISFELEVTNEGGLAVEDIVIHFPRPSGMIYTGNWPSEGNYNLTFDQWKISTLAAGQTERLIISLYAQRSSPAINAFAQVISASASDSDSSPNNRLCCTAIEDDEASLVIQPYVRTTGPTKTRGDSPRPFIPANNSNGFSFHRLEKSVIKTSNILVFSTDLDQTEALLIDGLGRVVKKLALAIGTGTHRYELDLSDQAPGAYTLLVNTLSGQEAIKVMNLR